MEKTAKLETLLRKSIFIHLFDFILEEKNQSLQPWKPTEIEEEFQMTNLNTY